MTAQQHPLPTHTNKMASITLDRCNDLVDQMDYIGTDGSISIYSDGTRTLIMPIIGDPILLQ